MAERVDLQAWATSRPAQGGMVGRTYLERGQPVTVLCRWVGKRCPHNVLIRRADGSLTVRPFRGLRRASW